MRPVTSRMDSGATGAGMVAVDGRLWASGDVVNTGPREVLGLGVVRSGTGGTWKERQIHDREDTKPRRGKPPWVTLQRPCRRRLSCHDSDSSTLRRSFDRQHGAVPGPDGPLEAGDNDLKEGVLNQPHCRLPRVKLRILYRACHLNLGSSLFGLGILNQFGRA